MSDSLKAKSRNLIAGLLVFVLTMAAGCGDGRPQRVPVSGIVKIDGVPLTRGFITFVPAEGRSATGDIDSEGRFTLTCYELGDGATLGTHQVKVTAREPLSETTARWLAPKKYTDPTTSGITVDVDGATSDVEINLTWDGGKPFVESDT